MTLPAAPQTKKDLVEAECDQFHGHSMTLPAAPQTKKDLVEAE